MGEWKCNQEVIMCSIKVVQTSFCTKPKPSFKKSFINISKCYFCSLWPSIVYTIFKIFVNGINEVEN